MKIMFDGDKALRWDAIPGVREYGYKLVEITSDGQQRPFGQTYTTTQTFLNTEDLAKLKDTATGAPLEPMRTYRVLIFPTLTEANEQDRLYFKLDGGGKILPADPPPPPPAKPPQPQPDPPQPSDKDKDERIRKLEANDAERERKMEDLMAQAKAIFQANANQPAQPAAAAPSNRGTQTQTETASAAPGGARAGATVREAAPAAKPKESTRTRDALVGVVGVVGVIALILLAILAFACVVYSKNKNWKLPWLSDHSAPIANEFGVNALTEELNQLKQKLDMEARARIVAPPLPGSATLSNSVQISGTSNANGAVIVGGSIGNNNTIVVNTGSGHILAPPLVIEVETNVPPVVTNCPPTHYWTNPPAAYVPVPEPQVYYYESAPRPVFANTYSYVGYYQYPSVSYQRNFCPPPPVIRCNVRPAFCQPSRPQPSGHYGGARPGNRPRGR